jgi:hypothetical protein
MFEGGGYGVAVTAQSVEPLLWPDLAPPPGMEVHPARLGEMMPVAARSQSERAVELQRVTVIEGLLAAYKVELVAAMARHRTATADRKPGEPGAASPAWAGDPQDDRLPEVSEFFPDELALTLNCSRAGATNLAELALTLTERLPGTWAALADGELDWPRARAIAGELGWKARNTPPAVVTAVEAAVLPVACTLSVSGVAAAVRRELLARDALAADARRRQAERGADVVLRPHPDGMAELSVFCPQPLAAAIRNTLEGYARMAKDAGDARPIGQLRVGVLADLVLRPWDTSRPPVTAHLTVSAPLPALRPSTTVAGQARPTAEVDGEPITAGALRELLEHLDALCPGGLQAPAGGSLHLALLDPHTGRLRAVLSRRDLQRLAAQGCPDHPDRDCRCPLLEGPPPVGRYRPTAAQRRFLSTRDRTCRHPGCRNRAAWADLDHVLPHADGGITDCTNLCCLCRRHHRLKTFAPGWSFDMDDDGILTVTTPTGVTRITRPPGLRPTPDPADDPPPF